MKVRRFVAVLVFALIIGGIGARQGWAYMQKSYGGACMKLDGFPGLLQKMNLLAKGDCTTSKGKCKNAGNKCSGATLTGLAYTGICSDIPSGCQCVAN